jgi:hypothetical protein
LLLMVDARSPVGAERRRWAPGGPTSTGIVERLLPLVLEQTLLEMYGGPSAGQIDPPQIETTRSFSRHTCAVQRPNIRQADRLLAMYLESMRQS